MKPTQRKGGPIERSRTCSVLCTHGSKTVSEKRTFHKQCFFTRFLFANANHWSSFSHPDIRNLAETFEVYCFGGVFENKQQTEGSVQQIYTRCDALHYFRSHSIYKRCTGGLQCSSDGTWKTYTSTVIQFFLEVQGKKVVPVATSGVLAIILDRERTAESMFKVTIPCPHDSAYKIPILTNIFEMLKQVDLNISDKAFMYLRLRESSWSNNARSITIEITIWTKVCTFFGDWLQTLPAVPENSRILTIEMYLKKSEMYGRVKVIRLTRNRGLLA